MQKKRRKNGSKDSIKKLRQDLTDMFELYNERMNEFTKRCDDIIAARGGSGYYYEALIDTTENFTERMDDLQTRIEILEGSI